MEALDAYTTYLQMVRWFHLIAGITWIGLLYFFNLVNVEVMKKLDGPTKGKVIPELMPRALWWFRWGAVATVLLGFMYYMSILKATAALPGSATTTSNLVLIWLGIVIVTYVIIYGVLQPVSGALNNGWTLAAIISVVCVAMSYLVAQFIGGDNKAVSIGIGGGLGLIMLLNVWGIIWRCQKQIIAWTAANAKDGTPIPKESATLARRAFLASRTNFYMSFPMLFFMAASSHYPWFGGK